MVLETGLIKIKSLDGQICRGRWFQVNYGDFYRITSDSYGVNLSALERRQCSLDKPLERSFGSIRKWLHGKFNVNPKTHLLTVHTVTSWETNGDFWELTLISRTEE